MHLHAAGRKARWSAHILLATGLAILSTSSALAIEPYRPLYQCPPGYRGHMAPEGEYYRPGPPAMRGTPRRGQPLPAAGSPSDLPSDLPSERDTERDTDQAAPSNQSQDPQQFEQQQTPQADPQQPQFDDFSAADTGSSRASLAPGADTPQLGRLDQANRLNLFDNMTAAPQNKAWFGYQYSSGINTGLVLNPELFHSGNYDASDFASSLGDDLASQGQGSLSLLEQQRQSTYRVGVEQVLSPCFSIAVQGQYYTNLDDDGYSDDWTNPQILFKYVICRDCDTLLSATLGVTPETGVELGDIDENTTRFYPGLLYYETLCPRLFSQGGFQFGIPVREDQIHTFDWSLSLGWWLYQDPRLACGGGQGGCCHGGGCHGGGCHGGPAGLITGIIPQIGLLGKHVLGDNLRAGAYGLQESSLFISEDLSVGTVSLDNGFFLYRELTDVLDLTLGTLILAGHNVQIGLGYSLPLSHQEVRQSEFISYVNYLF